MRCAAALFVVLAACGRIGFEQRVAMQDGGPDTSPPASGFSRLVAYGDATCAQYEGRAYCWGVNAQGQVGDPSMAEHTTPFEVPLPEGVLQVLTIGETHACAIVDTVLYCWGDLNGTIAGPTRIGGADMPWTDVAAGKRFTCGISQASAYCWGENDANQLGDGTNVPRTQPTPINSSASVLAVDVGDDHGCVLTTTNDAQCWGHNDQGALGMGAFAPANVATPTAVVGGITTLPRIAGWHACTVQSGQALCWGRNDEGALGDNTTTSRATPQLVPMFDAVTSIATGGGPADRDATCAIRQAGTLHCWGAGTGGRLGNGSATNELVPRYVTALANAVGAGVVVEVALGYAHTCARLGDGDIWCWGRGIQGQLGNGAKTDSFTPVRVMRPVLGS